MTDPQRSYIYLASPYSDTSFEVIEERYRAALAASAWLLSSRKWVFSPIVHCHHIARERQLPLDYAFWRDYNTIMIENASELLVLLIDGWKRSKGVSDEILFAQRIEKPVRFMRPVAAYYSISESPPSA